LDTSATRKRFGSGVEWARQRLVPLDRQPAAREEVLERIHALRLLSGLGGAVVDASVPDERAQQLGRFGLDHVIVVHVDTS
jgi:hypothetical protein